MSKWRVHRQVTLFKASPSSGSISEDKAPVPFLPKGFGTFPDEGFGEVQTPLKGPSDLPIPLGAPLFFRPGDKSRYVYSQRNRVRLPNDSTNIF